MTGWLTHEPRHREQVIATLLSDARHCEQKADALDVLGLTAAAEAFERLSEAYRDAAALLGYDGDKATIEVAG